VPPVSRAQTRAAERSTPGNLLVNVRFALTDREPGDWSGRLEVQGGRVEKLEGWHFPPAATQLERGPAAKCAITGPLSWRAQSQGDPPNRVHVDLSPIVPSPRPTWPLGLLVFLTADERTRLTLKFEKQPAVAFAVAELERGPARFNDNAVEAERLPRLHYVGGDNGEADYPSVTVAPDGAIWVAWQEYRAGSDRVLARRYSNGTWDSPVPLAENTDAYRTAVAQAGDSRVWVVWAAQANGEWALWGRSFDGRAWDAPQKLSTTPGPNMHHSLVADGQGNLWLAWQGFDHGQSDIFLRIYRSGRWGPVVRVSESSANDWEPSVAVDRAGRGWIAWDTYVAGNYDVLARSVMPGGTLGPVVSVASSPRFEAHASVAVDPRGRIWVAFDESGENWGKDWGFLSSDRGMALYMMRSLRVVCRDPSSGRSCGPEPPIQDVLPPEMQLYASLPSIQADGSGRIWVVPLPGRGPHAHHDSTGHERRLGECRYQLCRRAVGPRRVLAAEHRTQ
jgi:hypothetical protein